MRLTVKRLRHWILLAAGILIVVVAGYFLYGMFRFSREVKDLPQALGANIEQTASGYTYSQSSGGHTLFTIHASKLMAYRNGKALLHEVDITLYGPVGTHRKDRIRGTEFSYDPKTGIAQSAGEVEILLEGPGKALHPGADIIHVKTSGLSFDSRTGVAETTQYAEFSTPQASGHAIGANYNSKTGLLVLGKDVFFTSKTRSGTPIAVHAAGLTFWRDQQRAVLTQAVWTTPEETSSSDEATLEFRKDGTAKSLEEQGHVHLVTKTGTNLVAREATASFDANSQPEWVNLRGAVRLLSQTAAQKVQGEAGSAHLVFARFGKYRLLAHAELLGTAEQPVELDQQSFDASARSTAASRHLTGEVVNLQFVPAPGGRKSWADAVVIDHCAKIVLNTPSNNASAAQQTTILGDHLVAHLAGGDILRSLDGTGHTQWISLGQKGARTTIAGDQLHLMFAPVATAVATASESEKHHASRGNHGAQGARRGSLPRSTRLSSRANSRVNLTEAVVTGQVVLDQQPAAGADAQAGVQKLNAQKSDAQKKEPELQEPVHAWASKAIYQAASNTIQLFGHPRLEQGKSLEVAAKEVTINRAAGQAQAIGQVQVTYREPGKSGEPENHAGAASDRAAQPMHATAARAEMDRASGKIFFYGDQWKTARLWQAGNAVWAPVIELVRDGQQLEAYGSTPPAGSMAAPAVRAYFDAVLGAGRKNGLVRVVSDRMSYSARSRVAHFNGRVEAVDAMGTLLASEVSMQLAPARAQAVRASSSMSPMNSAQLERMVATGGVHLVEPGREAVGQKLVYTGENEQFVLTGSPEARPYLVDREHGRTSGAALIFNNQNDSVEIIKGEGSAVTVTRAPR